MELFTFVAGTILAGLVVYLAIRMVWVIVRNLIQGTWLRRRLGRELADLPMNRALERAGIDAVKYLHKERIVDINHHLRNCEACPDTQLCEEELDAGKSPEEFDFCPNRDDLFQPKS
jgi:hypothetical protein